MFRAPAYLPFSSFLFLTAVVLANEFIIHDVNEFENFMNNVNSGKRGYSSTTICLDSDIDFANKTFEPIGNSTSNYFKGVFDGRGHTISSITFNSSSPQYVGLFGFSRGHTIKNLVLDSSCSFVSHSCSDDEYGPSIGSFIGRCFTESRALVVENCVNMAGVTFDGSVKYLYIGGIAGRVLSKSQNVSLKNCANYGNVSNYGHVTEYVHMGGIVGDFDEGTKVVQNCFNFGDIVHNGVADYKMWIGGIIGETDKGNVSIENCVNAGKIISNQTCSGTGNILGTTNDESNTTITHCFWTNNTNCNKSHSYDTSDAKVSCSSQVELGYESMNELNEYAANNTWSKWFLNPNGATVTFNVNGKTYISLSTVLVLLPEIVDNGANLSFSGWYADTYLTQKFNSSIITEDKTLYGLYGVLVNVTLDMNYEGCDTPPYLKVAVFNCSYGELPSPNRVGYTLVGWFTAENESITSNDAVKYSSDHSLYAHWAPSNYTIAFNASGGTVSPVSKVVTFGNVYGTLPTPSREGHTFFGWVSEGNKYVENGTIVSTAKNHTLHAQWKEVPTNFVEIVFGVKNLSEGGVEEIVKKYVGEGAEYKIVKYSKDSEGLVIVVVKFEDVKDAENFIGIIGVSSAMGSTIKRIGFTQESVVSLAASSNPMINILFV